MCRAAAAAAPITKWRSAVRIGRSGAVLEPANGAFDVTVTPGVDVQAAVDKCPPGGCVLLLPGTHHGSLSLLAEKKVHVFGRGRATLWPERHFLLQSEADTSTCDGLVLGREHGDFGMGNCVVVSGGGLRLQACDVRSMAAARSIIVMGGADPVLASCRCEWGGAS